MSFVAERKSLIALGMVAVTSRLIYSALVDMPQLGNGIWIALGVALMLCLPLSLLLDWLGHSFNAPAHQVLEQALGTVTARVWYIAAFALMVWDAACDGRMLNCISSYFALSARSLVVLFGLTVVVVSVGCLRGMQTISDVAQVWLRFVPLLLLMIIIALFSRAQFGWLFPLLGGELTNSLMAGFSLGGHCALISLFCLSANPSREKNDFMTTKILASSILLCALVALLARVMSPHLVNVETTRVLAIERLLANGRAPMTLQLFTMIISYSNLLLTCSFDLLMSAHLLKLTIPALPGWACVAVSGAICLALGLMGWAEQYAALFLNAYRYFVLALPAIVLCCAALIKQKRRRMAHG